MARSRKRKKKGPAPVNPADHKDYRDRWRRVIRILMVAVGVVLLMVALGIPVANNAIALGLEKDMKALPLPEDTRLLEVSSVAGKLEGNGNGMQYFAALLIESSRTAEELETYFNSLEQNSLSRQIQVVDYCEDTEPHRVVDALPLTGDRADNRYVVYRAGGGDSPLQGWLDMDLRGH